MKKEIIKSIIYCNHCNIIQTSNKNLLYGFLIGLTNTQDVIIESLKMFKSNTNVSIIIILKDLVITVQNK